jgi:hypothetical protein
MNLTKLSTWADGYSYRGIIKKVVPEALDLLIEIRNRGAGFAPFKVVNTF